MLWRTLLTILVLAMLYCVAAKPTLYLKNSKRNLQPVLVPVSSTVIPLIYGREFSREFYSGRNKPKYSSTLLTVNSPKVPESEETADVQPAKPPQRKS
ncbi:hypothetical protein B566_EDAN009795 [Ephemera danica]|nr:hypothetical protein B566_EDAN009795 [Ephemera danica]